VINRGLALCLLYVAFSLAAESDVLTFGNIVQFKEMADHDLKMRVDMSQPAMNEGFATDLGDTNQDEVEAVRETNILSADHVVMLLGKELAKHQKAQQEAAQLGESAAVSPFEEEDEVEEQKLDKLLKPSSGKSIRKVGDRVAMLLDYLGQRMMQGEPLNEKELNKVRGFYLDETAHVLGAYAYDASGSQIHQSELARDTAHDERKLADRVKHDMDKTDADMHMSKMGVHAEKNHNDEPESHDLENWMMAGKGMAGKGDSHQDMSNMGGKGKGGKGMSIMEMMMGGKGKGGKGMGGMGMGSKDEDEMPVVDSDPLTHGGPAPRFDSIMQHLEEAGRLANFVDQVEQSCQLGQSHDSTMEDLEANEGKITSGIEELLSKVKQGKLFARDNDNMHSKGSPKAQLKSALTQAASKEDDAKIVQDAGAIAEGQIKDTLAQGLAMKPVTAKKEAKPVHEKKKEIEPETTTNDSNSEDEMTEDIHVPVEHLRDHSVAALDKTLTGALNLYTKRHKQHKQLSVEEHKSLSAELRTIAAHLMRKVQHSNKVEHSNVAEEQKPASLPKPTEPPTHAAKATQAPSKVVPAATQTPTQPAPVHVPAKPMVQGGAVKQFIWHVLGKNTQSQQPSTAPTLAGLLRKGVTLFNGAKMFFDIAKPVTP